MPKVSVIIPIYNVEKYLEQCLTSVVNQTLKDIEIICVNDGSTDKSLEIIEKFAKNDKRIVIINQKNSGLGAAYNNGIKTAKGEYIGLVESDDYVDINMFEYLYNCSQKDDIDVVKSDFYVITEDNLLGKFNKIPEFYNDKIFANIDLKPYIERHASIWTGIYKRQFLIDNDICFHETKGAAFQDVGFNFKTWLSAKKIYAVSRPFYYYRFNSANNSSNRKDELAAYSFLLEYSLLDEHIKMKNFPKFLKILKNKQEFIDLFRNFNERFHTPYAKYKFIAKLSKLFRSQIAQKEYDKSIWSDKEWEDYTTIANSPILFLINGFMRKFKLSLYILTHI